jgi:hypothetical protein
MKGVATEDIGGEGIDERLQRRRCRSDKVEVSRLTPSRAKISA